MQRQDKNYVSFSKKKDKSKSQPALYLPVGDQDRGLEFLGGKH